MEGFPERYQLVMLRDIFQEGSVPSWVADPCRAFRQGLIAGIQGQASTLGLTGGLKNPVACQISPDRKFHASCMARFQEMPELARVVLSLI